MTQNDIEQVKNLITKVFGKETQFQEIKRLGGLSNRNYYVLTNIGEFCARLPGFGSEFTTNRANEKISTELACKIKIDTELFYFDSKTGEKIARYIKNSKTMNPESLKNKKNIEKIAQIYQKLHSSNIDTKIVFSVLDTVEMYEKIINKTDVKYYHDFYDVKKFIYPFIKKQINYAKKVTCHNDPVCENWILQNNEKMYLIDWEYGGMNNPIWDLALVSSEANFEFYHDKFLLEKYLKKEATTQDFKEFYMHKMIINYYLSLWAKTRVPYDGQPLEDYSFEHYQKMHKNIKEYESF